MGYKYVITLTQGAFYQVNHPTLLIEMLQHWAFLTKRLNMYVEGADMLLRHALSSWGEPPQSRFPVQLGGQFLSLPFVCLLLFPSS